MNAVAIAVRCNWCSKQKPNFRVHRLTNSQVICDECLEWHMHALAVMGGAMPTGCQECGAGWETVLGAEQLRVYIVQKDGIYQVLCRACTESYTPKRGDLYRGTKYGKSLNL